MNKVVKKDKKKGSGPSAIQQWVEPLSNVMIKKHENVKKHSYVVEILQATGRAPAPVVTLIQA